MAPVLVVGTSFSASVVDDVADVDRVDDGRHEWGPTKGENNDAKEVRGRTRWSTAQ